MYTAIDLDINLIPNVALFGRQSTDPTAAFLHGLHEKHDLPDTECLIGSDKYLIVLSIEIEQSPQSVDQDHIGK